MKLAFYPLSFLLILVLFQGSNGSDLIRESCSDASKGDQNINYDFCVASLEAISKSPPTSVQELVGMSIQMTKSNATNVVSIISDLLKYPRLNEIVKACLKDCSDLYSDSLSDLEDALGAFKSKDFGTASIKISAAMDASDTCEEQFNDEKVKSPLTEDNKMYFELNAMSLAFIKMSGQQS